MADVLSNFKTRTFLFSWHHPVNLAVSIGPVPLLSLISSIVNDLVLVEGKRRAMYNKFEQEKIVNKDRQAEIDHILKVKKSAPGKFRFIYKD